MIIHDDNIHCPIKHAENIPVVDCQSAGQEVVSLICIQRQANH